MNKFRIYWIGHIIIFTIISYKLYNIETNLDWIYLFLLYLIWIISSIIFFLFWIDGLSWTNDSLDINNKN